MRFLSLEVRHFRAVERAAVELGPGLNVLYGPNDLGKTTLVRALRAALLLPCDSAVHKELVSWHSRERPEVCVVFSVPPEREFRLRKVFGAGSEGSSELFVVSKAGELTLDQRGRGVDRRLRELLGWGIESPGGRSGSRGLPESFLSQVLLGEQAAPVALLGRGLASDREESGRLALQEALATLGQDPVFQGVLERADEQVRIAFTPTGRRRGGKDSPFFGFRERIQSLTEQAQQLAAQRRETEEVQRALASLAERRAELDALLRSGREKQDAMRGELRLLDERQQAEQALAAATQAWQRHQAAEAALERLRGELREAEQVRDRAEQAQGDVQARWAAAQKALADAEAERQRQGSRRAELGQQHAQAERALAQAQARRERLEGHQRVAAELALAERALASAEDERSAAQRALRSAREAQREAEQELARERKLLLAAQWVQAERALATARAAEEKRAEDEGELLRAETERGELSAALATSATLAGEHQQLRDSAAELRLAQARLDLGLELRLAAPPGGLGGAVDLRLDGERSVEAPDQALLEVSARSRVEARLASGLLVTAQAGSAEQRARVEQLASQLRDMKTRVFARWEVSCEEELVQRLEERRQQELRVAELGRKCESLRERLVSKVETAAELAKWARQVDALQRELGGNDQEREALREATDGQEPWARESAVRAVEKSLEERRRAVSKAEQGEAEWRVQVQSTRERHERAEEAMQALIVQASSTQPLSLPVEGMKADGMAGAIEEELARSRRECGQLRARVAELSRELDAMGAELTRTVEHRSGEVSALRDESKAAEIALQTARESAIALRTSYEERRRTLDSAEGQRLKEEQAHARSRFQALPQTEPNLPDHAAAVDAEIEKLEQELSRVQAELARTEGRLSQVGGDVVLERERSVQHALQQTERRQGELELDYDAYQLLTQVLREVESEQGAHLGKALADPLSQRFSQLTRGRYRELSIDQDLAFSGVHVAGEERSSRELSEGTQEQLVALLRLCIAEHLRQAIVLDDHLVQTHRERADWFRAFLREVAQKVQVLVVTARPEDYVGVEEMPQGEEETFRDAVSRGADLRVINLERIVQRFEP